MITTVTAARLRCDHTEDSGTQCPIHLLLPAPVSQAFLREAAQVRGWTCHGPDLCPMHRGLS